MEIIAGDIGGTKTNLGIFSSQNDWKTPIIEATFANSDYPNFETIIQEFG